MHRNFRKSCILIVADLVASILELEKWQQCRTLWIGLFHADWNIMGFLSSHEQRRFSDTSNNSHFLFHFFPHILWGSVVLYYTVGAQQSARMLPAEDLQKIHSRFVMIWNALCLCRYHTVRRRHTEASKAHAWSPVALVKLAKLTKLIIQISEWDFWTGIFATILREIRWAVNCIFRENLPISWPMKDLVTHRKVFFAHVESFYFFQTLFIPFPVCCDSG